MPKDFKKIFMVEKMIARVYKRTSRNTLLYDIKLRRDGINISVTAKSLEEAKSKFLEKLKNYNTTSQEQSAIPKGFESFTRFYIEKYHKRKISEVYCKTIYSVLNTWVFPKFKDAPIDKINTNDCQNLIDDAIEKGKSRTAQNIYVFLGIIFKAAINFQLIKINPLTMVVKEKHQMQHGKAFSAKETKSVIDAFSDNPVLQKNIAVLLYCGLRPNELESIKIEKNFIIAKNSKRKKGKEAVKRIPILPQLQPFLVDFELCSYQVIVKRFKRKFPDHKLYDLRTTYYTMCQEFGVAPPARDYFVGHSSNVLTETYTDLSDEYLLEEAKKLHNKF